MTMVILCLACIATALIISRLRGSMDRMQRQRVRASRSKAERRSRGRQ